ncbi:Signal transduction histidine kinase [Salipiger thiooxidans]|uniref:histidine kinase n=1 Tax=Salipiger thiooxidans TaxID=282683 RepID=A0A1G7BGE7_9RHOB|nr:MULTISPECIES: HAMP domain-containing sensor histidine kinase [Salipiger]SDE26052.1 Signal transduction histidine kinase [Salipiger thiooxidans]
MTRRWPVPLRLRTLGMLLCLAAFLSGVGASVLWFASSRAWDRHLERAFIAGLNLSETLQQGLAPPEGVSVTPLPPAQAALAGRGAFSRLDGLPRPSIITNVSLIEPGPDPVSGTALSLAIVSDSLQYPVAAVVSAEGQGVPQKLASVTRLLATYCSEPILVARHGDGDWLRIDGTAVWGCGAGPSDYRLLAVFLSLVALVILVTVVADTSAQFDRFARALRDRRRLGGPESYTADGPEELREIVSAVNAYLDTERAQLEKRAVVLSGISHDLGTPATRLRLRAALIPDPALREKLEADIDRMTGMIESVLTLTRSEINAEAPRQLSLNSLVEAMVDDYRDTGRPVELLARAARIVEGGGSLFSAKRGHGALPRPDHVLVVGRPLSLQRAVSNLIDNALKYGRRAIVGIEASVTHVVITVEDEGSELSVAEIEAVIAPFQRGSNHGSIDGFGLGLTIVDTVAEQHGGRLYFEEGAHGLRACLQIQRG